MAVEADRANLRVWLTVRVNAPKWFAVRSTHDDDRRLLRSRRIEHLENPPAGELEPLNGLLGRGCFCWTAVERAVVQKRLSGKPPQERRKSQTRDQKERA